MIIKFYNSKVVQREMVGMVLEATNSMPDYHYLQSLFAVGRLVNCNGPINRLQPGIFKFDHSCPIPNDLSNAPTFQQAATYTARDILNQAGDRPIGVFWSGGIDSTVALVALMQECEHWQERLIIYTSNYAIQHEYPVFYHNFLQQANVVLLEPKDFFDANLFRQNIFMVDGNLGDQVWGINLTIDQPDFCHRPYPALFDWQHFRNRVGEKQWLDATVSYIEQQIKHFPAPVKSLFDLLWMLTFTHKWNFNRLKHMSRVPDITLLHQMHCFYDSYHLQRWSMATTDSRIKDSPESYKQAAKDFIYLYTKDQIYRDTKLQQNSMPKFMPMEYLDSYFVLITDQAYRTREQLGCDIMSESIDWSIVPEK